MEFKVDYSVIKDDDEMFKYEAYHLEQYRKEIKHHKILLGEKISDITP